MKRVFAFTLISLSLVPFISRAEMPAGQALVDSDCQQCHDNSIYTRQNSILHNLPGLKKRVAFCERASGHTWNDKQRDQVIEYLNNEYYHFPLQSR